MIDHKALIAVLSFGASCAVNTTDATSEKSNEAGVTTYRVTETADDLMIIGEDAAGKVVGHVEVKKGRYTMSEWFASDRSADERDVDGIRVYVEVDGTPPWSHEADGYHALKLGIPDGERYHRFDAFALDPRVTQPLADWGIKFTSQYMPSPTSETAYDFAGDWCMSAYTSYYTSEVSTYNLCGINQHPANQEFTATIGYYAQPSYKSTDELCICNESNCPGVAQGHMFFSRKECCGYAFCTTNDCGGTGSAGCAVCGGAVDTGYTYANRNLYIGLGIGQNGADCYVGPWDLGSNPCGTGMDELCHYY